MVSPPMFTEQSTMDSEGRPIGAMEATVRRTLFGANISREGWEALWDGDAPPISDMQLELENIFELVRRQGRIVAELAHSERTRDELNTTLASAVERLPLWLTSRVYGPSVATPQAIVRDFAELLRAHRGAILRVTREQAADTQEIEGLLAETPVPERDDDDLSAAAVGDVIAAHSDALLLLAIDFDAWSSEN